MPLPLHKILFKGKQIAIKKGALRRQLRLKKNERFTKREVFRLKNVPVGTSFLFRGRPFKMTLLLKRRVTFAYVLMKRFKTR